MRGEFDELARQAVTARISGRGADQQAHRHQPPGDQLAVLQDAVAKRHVDAPGGEIGRPVVQQQVERDLGIALAKATQQRRHHAPAEAAGRADSQGAARRPAAQLAHLVERLRDLLDARAAMLVEQLPLARELGAARGAQQQARVELGLELLHVAADRRAADAEPLAGLRETPFGRHREEGDHARVAGGEAGGENVVAARAGGGAMIGKQGHGWLEQGCGSPQDVRRAHVVTALRVFSPGRPREPASPLRTGSPGRAHRPCRPSRARCESRR